MDKSNSAEEVEEVLHPGYLSISLREIDHRSHGGTRLFSAAAYCAVPVLRTAVTTDVAEDTSDGRDGVEPTFPNVS